MIETRLLTIKDLSAVEDLDKRSGFYVSQWLDDNEDYAWGVFKDEKLVGYCSTGYADDTLSIIEKHPKHTNNSILLSDVYVLPEYRHFGYGSKLVSDAIKKRWKSDKEENIVFAVLLCSSLIYFYEKIGFKLISASDDIDIAMCFSADNLTQSK